MAQKKKDSSYSPSNKTSIGLSLSAASTTEYPLTYSSYIWDKITTDGTPNLKTLIGEEGQFDQSTINEVLASSIPDTSSFVTSADVNKTLGTHNSSQTAHSTLFSNKQDKITTSNKLSASLISGLSKVATSGKYTDLSDTPEIPSIEGLAKTSDITDHNSSDTAHSALFATKQDKITTTNKLSASLISGLTTVNNTTVYLRQGTSTSYDSLGSFTLNNSSAQYIYVPKPGDGTVTIKQGEETLGSFMLNQSDKADISIPVPETPGSGTLKIYYGSTLKGTFSANESTGNTVTATIPVPNNSKITLKKGTDELGSFTLNQSGASDITIPDYPVVYNSSVFIRKGTTSSSTLLGSFTLNASTSTSIYIPDYPVVNNSTVYLRFGTSTKYKAIGSFTLNNSSSQYIYLDYYTNRLINGDGSYSVVNTGAIDEYEDPEYEGSYSYTGVNTFTFGYNSYGGCSYSAIFGADHIISGSNYLFVSGYEHKISNTYCDYSSMLGGYMNSISGQKHTSTSIIGGYSNSVSNTYSGTDYQNISIIGSTSCSVSAAGAKHVAMIACNSVAVSTNISNMVFMPNITLDGGSTRIRYINANGYGDNGGILNIYANYSPNGGEGAGGGAINIRACSHYKGGAITIISESSGVSNGSITIQAGGAASTSSTGGNIIINSATSGSNLGHISFKIGSTTSNKSYLGLKLDGAVIPTYYPSSNGSVTLQPYTIYNGSLASNITFKKADAPSSDQSNEYAEYNGIITTGTTLYTVTWPTGVTMTGDVTLEKSSTYWFTIMGSKGGIKKMN